MTFLDFLNLSEQETKNYITKTLKLKSYTVFEEEHTTFEKFLEILKIEPDVLITNFSCYNEYGGGRSISFSIDILNTTLTIDFWFGKGFQCKKSINRISEIEIFSHPILEDVSFKLYTYYVKYVFEKHNKKFTPFLTELCKDINEYKKICNNAVKYWNDGTYVNVVNQFLPYKIKQIPGSVLENINLITFSGYIHFVYNYNVDKLKALFNNSVKFELIHEYPSYEYIQECLTFIKNEVNNKEPYSKFLYKINKKYYNAVKKLKEEICAEFNIDESLIDLFYGGQDASYFNSKIIPEQYRDKYRNG